MALTRVIKEEVFTKLLDAFKGEYKKQDDGTYILDLTDYEDPAALKRAKDHEKDQRKAAEKAAKDAKDALDLITAERDGMLAGTIPKGDVAKLEKSYQDKLAAKEAELGGTIKTLQGSVQTMLVDNVALAIATEISTSPQLILPHIAKRLKADQVDGKYVTRVVDATGALSALTVEELKKEFVLNKDYAAIITASKASGAGGSGGSGGGGAGAGQKIDHTKSPKEVAAALRAKHNLPEVTR